MIDRLVKVEFRLFEVRLRGVGLYNESYNRFTAATSSMKCTNIHNIKKCFIIVYVENMKSVRHFKQAVASQNNALYSLSKDKNQVAYWMSCIDSK